MRALDIVVNLWTPDLTKNYTPKLNAFWRKVKILGETADGIPLEEEIRRMDAAGIEQGLLSAITGGWEGSDIHFEKPVERIAEVVAAHPVTLDAMVGGWIGERDLDEVVAAFEAAEAAVAPIYDVRHVMSDPQFEALGSIATVDDPELGPLKMQNVMFRLTGTPGWIQWAGQPMGADNDAVFGGLLDLSAEERQALKEKGVI